MSHKGLRRHPRINTELDAVVVTRGGNREAHQVVISQLSEGGAFIECDVHLGMGRVVVIEGKYSWGEFEVPCRILYQSHNDGKLGMGVRFEPGEAGPPESLLGYINQQLPEAVRNIMDSR